MDGTYDTFSFGTPATVCSDGELSWLPSEEQPLTDNATLTHSSSPPCPVANMSLDADLCVDEFDFGTTIDPTCLELTDLPPSFFPTADEAVLSTFSAPPAAAAASLAADPNVAMWNYSAPTLSSYPPSDTMLRTCVELSTSQIQALLSRVHALEVTLQKTQDKFQEFLDWSKKMEKHNEESSNIILSLVGTVKNSEHYRSASTEPQDSTCLYTTWTTSS